MHLYLDLLHSVLETGVRKKDRTGTGVLSLFGEQRKYNLAAGFPLLTTKKIYFHSVLHELLWFIRGDRNIRYLQDHGVHLLGVGDARSITERSSIHCWSHSDLSGTA